MEVPELRTQKQPLTKEEPLKISQFPHFTVGKLRHGLHLRKSAAYSIDMDESMKSVRERKEKKTIKVHESRELMCKSPERVTRSDRNVIACESEPSVTCVSHLIVTVALQA